MSMIKRLLLVDDDADDRFLFEKALEEIKSTISFFFATDGEAALETLQVIPLPDLIFLDLNLPRLNGLQCLEKIKQHHQYAAVPVIIYSTTFTEGDKVKAKQLGASHFLTKPFSLSALCRELVHILSIDWKKHTA